jgi:ABC-type branched-subunit amino acid transport system substrate-binding protein
MTTTRRQFLHMAGGATAMAAVGLQTPALAQNAPLRIGVLAAKAGVTAPVGESGLRGTQFAVDRINSGGGILGRRIELILDEEPTPRTPWNASASWRCSRRWT